MVIDDDGKDNDDYNGNCGDYDVTCTIVVTICLLFCTLLQFWFLFLHVGIAKTDDNHFAPMAEQAINVIYALSEHPETVSEKIIRQLVTQLIVKQDGQTPEPTDSQDTQTPGPTDSQETQTPGPTDIQETQTPLGMAVVMYIVDEVIVMI